MKRILITGANSYIGTSVEKYLAQWPEEYHVDTIDMVDGSWREKSFAGYDSVFHVAGIAHFSTKKLDKTEQKKYWIVNAELPVEVAKKAKVEGVKQFIFLSSMSVYGEHGSIKQPVIITNKTKPHPKDIYGRSKLEAEEGLTDFQEKSFAVCLLRPPMIYGPGSKGNYQHLIKAARQLPLFPNIRNQRSMLRIDGLCDFVKGLVDSGTRGLFFPQDPVYVCTSAMVADLARGFGRKIWLTRAFNPILRLLSGRISLADKVFGSLTYEKSMSHDKIGGQDVVHEFI